MKQTGKKQTKKGNWSKRNSKSKQEYKDEKKLPNNPYWYGSTPEIIRDTASLPYGYPVGRMFDTGNTTQTSNYTYGRYIGTPGVMSFFFHPAIGVATNSNDPINIAARNLYSWVRHANSGHTNYDAPDLMLYMLAMDSLYCMYAWGCRIYGLLRQYNHVNRYWPRVILESEYINVDDFQNNIANFRYFLDIFAKKVGSMCVPNCFPYFARHTQIVSEVYTDAPVLKSQMYIFTPANLWYYDETSGAGQLVALHTKPLNAASISYSQWVNNANTMIDKIIGSEDLNIMSGDILKAFGQDKLVKLNYVPIDYETPIKYSPEMLSQIQNLTVSGTLRNGLSDTTGYNVTQDVNTGALLFKPESPKTSIYDTRKLITMDHEDVKPEETIVATRLTAFPVVRSTGTGTTFNTLGSEFIMAARIYYMGTNGLTTSDNWQGEGLEMDMSSSSGTSLKWTTASMIEKFNQHPMVPVYNNESGNEGVITRLQDIDNYTVITEEELKEMNEGALLSMFAVPQLGLWSSTYDSSVKS